MIGPAEQGAVAVHDRRVRARVQVYRGAAFDEGDGVTTQTCEDRDLVETGIDGVVGYPRTQRMGRGVPGDRIGIAVGDIGCDRRILVCRRVARWSDELNLVVAGSEAGETIMSGAVRHRRGDDIERRIKQVDGDAGDAWLAGILTAVEVGIVPDKVTDARRRYIRQDDVIAVAATIIDGIILAAGHDISALRKLPGDGVGAVIVDQDKAVADVTCESVEER